jgi:hypothetical protein
MKRYLLLILLLFFIVQIASSQDPWKRRRYEALVGLGTSHIFGDIGGFSKSENVLGFKDFSFVQTRFNVHLGLRYKILQDVAVKFGLTYAMFHSDDKRGSNEDRELESRTSAFEPLLTGEYYFIKSAFGNSYLFQKGRKTTFKRFLSSFDVFGYTGIGGIAYGVKGNDQFVVKNLPVKSNGFAAVLPLGVGANIYFAPDYTLGLNISGRYAFTDMLDGYSSQYSKSNDVYYFMTFTFTYKIETNSRGIPLFLSRRRF